jgi:hypothetical protein
MRRAVLTMLLLAAPRVALACPVCFGENNSPMALGARTAVIFMLVFVGGVLAAFASFFIYLMRRARMVAGDAGPAPSGPATELGADAGRHVEGTASC